MGINGSNIAVEAIICRLRQFNDLASDLSKILNSKLIFHNYQCPRCSKTFALNQDLEQHFNENHVPITTNNVHMDYLGNLKPNEKSHPDDRYKAELHCLVCCYGWQTLEARENHIIQDHPNAIADDFD
ncbi:unnamed protein product [Rotaria magnacalcarata]|uniref:C2H2-type domain-containing protein n=2 Tax=Rotaria TaxID=231623 RepID=A0A816UIP4_9BILA|nr:unnamed protein product [Rotaria magnacalcarata]CAF3396544.1 unnamed protein product [Rotaria socialis]CAF2114617.1 unnamed protein product [Rotaria magnacalcarata]CAF2131210.1 unnamed protein product [Rotaria magnacalcarata]CAF3515938.1 unnamed protein product [Rotaria socialis]